MNILIIANKVGAPNGWGRYSYDFVKALVDKGHNVSVLCQEANETVDFANQYALLPKPLAFKKNFLLALKYSKNAYNKLQKKEKFDLAHCLVEPYALITYLLSKRFHIPYFITIHGSFGIKTVANFWLKFLQTIAYKNAKQVICISNYTKKQVLKKVMLKNITIIPNGSSFPVLKNPARPSSKKTILSVGALKLRKGMLNLVQAFAKISEDHKDVSLEIVGDDSDKEYTDLIRKHIQEHNLGDRITIYPDLAEKELLSKYESCYLFALLPLSDEFNFEGFGLVYLEANAYGKPVVGGYESGAEEAVKEGHNGFLADPKNPNDIARAIKKLLEDDTLYQETSKNALLWAREHTWSRIIDRYIAIYQKI